jgi:hypothetical protein
MTVRVEDRKVARVYRNGDGVGLAGLEVGAIPADEAFGWLIGLRRKRSVDLRDLTVSAG